MVSFDILIDNGKLAPGAVWAWCLSPIAGKDGVKTTFGLTTKETLAVPSPCPQRGAAGVS